MTTIVEGKPYKVFATDKTKYEAVIAAINDKDYEKLKSLVVPSIGIRKIIATSSSEAFSYAHGQVWFNNVPVNNFVAKRMLELRDLGLNISYLENFLVKLLKNPNKEVIPFAYEFVEYGGLPLTPSRKHFGLQAC